MRSRLSLLALLFALAGCAPSNPGIEIEGLLALSSDCSARTAEEGPFLLSPTLDTSPDFGALRIGGIRYTATLQVVNRMINTGNTVWPIMADPNTFFAEEAEVELTDVGGEALDLGGLPARFRVPTSGIVPSAGGADDYGRGIVAVDLVPTVYGDALATRTGTIIATVRITGTTSGDSTQTTGDLSVPIQLCDGCLFGCPADLTTDALSCRPGQDAASALAAGPASGSLSSGGERRTPRNVEPVTSTCEA